MGEDARKTAIKKLLAQTGQVLGADGGRRLVVLRFPNAEEVSAALRLLPRAFPRIQWQSVAVRSGHAAHLIRVAAGVADAQERKVAVLHDFPGELEERALDQETAEAFEAAVGEGLLEVPVVVAVLAGSVRVLADHAPTFWQGKAGYFAWPSPVRLPEETATPQDEPVLTHVGASADDDRDPPTERETRQVLAALKGKEAADYLVQVARSHLQSGGSENARLFLLRAVQLYSESADLEGMARAYHLLGLGAQQRGDYEAALEWYSQASDNLRIVDNHVDLAEALGQTGYVYYLRGQYEPAVKAFNEALELDTALGLVERESAGYRKLAMVLELMKKFSSASELYAKSLAIEEKLDNLPGQARVFHHLGRLEELQQNFDGAVEYYRRSIDLKVQINDHSGLATTYHQLGNLHLLKMEYEEALEQYRMATEQERNERDRQGLARTNAQMGLVYRELGDVEKALFHLVHAYQLFQKLRSPLATEVLAKVEELQDMVPPDTFNKILREASMTTSSV